MPYWRKEVLKSAADVSGLCAKLANLPKQSITISACCWTDLLGYGTPFYDSNWEPSDKDLNSQANRIANAHLQCYSNLEPTTEFVLTLNDGVVRCCDQERFQHLDFLSMWLRACIWTHNAINKSEKKENLPGARTVLACGKTLKYSHVNVCIDDFVYNYTKSDPAKLSKIARTTGNPTVAVNPGPLQMNLAFSKAYLLESWGSKVGIEGPHFFIDESLLLFIQQMHRCFNSPFKIIDEQKQKNRLFALPSRKDNSRFHLGLELLQPPIQIENKYMKTNIWRLLGFYPCDEDVKDFKNPVE